MDLEQQSTTLPVIEAANGSVSHRFAYNPGT
jgi:hypothetical protein